MSIIPPLHMSAREEAKILKELLTATTAGRQSVPEGAMDSALHLQIPSFEMVRRDAYRNLPWSIAVLLIGMVYALVSAAVIRIWEGWTFAHAAYFTVINMTTVGFGDVTPATHVGKLIAGLNGLAGLLLFGVLVAVVTMALQPAGWTASGAFTAVVKKGGLGATSNEGVQAQGTRRFPLNVLEGVRALLKHPVFRRSESRTDSTSPTGAIAVAAVILEQFLRELAGLQRAGIIDRAVRLAIENRAASGDYESTVEDALVVLHLANTIALASEQLQARDARGRQTSGGGGTSVDDDTLWGL